MTSAQHATCQHLTYRITCEQFDALVERAESACEICGQGAARLRIDHDHATGTVRGLLCAKCNAHMRFVDGGERETDERTVRYLALAVPDGGQAWGAVTNTPGRGPFRFPDEEWLPAKERAAERGETMTDVMRRALREYVADGRPAAER